VLQVTRPQAVAAGSLVIGFLLLCAKLLVGLLTGSLGIISEAAHSAFDLAASGFALVAVRTAAKPADREHPYGHGRAENLAAFGEGIVLLLTALGIAYEALRRLFGEPVQVNAAGYALALMVGSMVVEAGRAAVLRSVGRSSGSSALEADAENRVADVLSSLGVLAGLVGVRLGYLDADALAALVVAALIARAAVRVSWRAGDILMDRAPAGVDEQLRQAIHGVEGIREVRSVRVRRSGVHLLADARVSTRRTLSVERAQALSDDVRRAVDDAVPNVDLTLVVEGQEEAANLVERVHAAAGRTGGFQDLHNVTVEKESDGSLHLSMHAKLPGGTTLAEASRSSGQLEDELRSEFPEVSRVDVHLEPLEPDIVTGADVTEGEAELAGRIRRLVEGHPRVTHCRDVELSSRDGRITAYVVAEMSGRLSLEEAHEVETDIEERVRRSFPELHEIVARATV
jgi:cation diffusion facilitator family transporter